MMKWEELRKQLINSRYYYFHTDNGVLLCGDSSEVMRILPNESVDLLLTDPPYPKQFAHLYDILASESPRILKSGSSLLTIVGHYALPNVIQKFEGKLKYRWIFCMNQESGKHPRMAMGIEVLWKPILWYVKETFPKGKGFIKDMLKITDSDGIKKKFHEWQQSKQWAEFFISKLTSDLNSVILDPFIGSGTTAVVSEELNRKWIGIEILESNCKITQNRILGHSKRQKNLMEY